jgi:hypothetical protein
MGKTSCRRPRVLLPNVLEDSDRRVRFMRYCTTSAAIGTPGSRTFSAGSMLTLALGLAVAHTMLSAALSARAETQAAIDAVTLARPHLPTAADFLRSDRDRPPQMPMRNNVAISLRR